MTPWCARRPAVPARCRHWTSAALCARRNKMSETFLGSPGPETPERGGTGDVHCEKVQCPRLACAQPVRANPTDCCKQCPVGSGVHPQLGDPMQADGPRGCRFAGQWFPESQSWHPSVPPFGEMSCITCRCGAGVPHCERDDCSLPLSCGPGKESRCCSHCAPRRPPETRTVPELAKEAEGS